MRMQRMGRMLGQRQLQPPDNLSTDDVRADNVRADSFRLDSNPQPTPERPFMGARRIESLVAQPKKSSSWVRDLDRGFVG
jgi:hypothetical protein